MLTQIITRGAASQPQCLLLLNETPYIRQPKTKVLKSAETYSQKDKFTDAGVLLHLWHCQRIIIIETEQIKLIINGKKIPNLLEMHTLSKWLMLRGIRILPNSLDANFAHYKLLCLGDYSYQCHTNTIFSTATRSDKSIGGNIIVELK